MGLEPTDNFNDRARLLLNWESNFRSPCDSKDLGVAKIRCEKPACHAGGVSCVNQANSCATRNLTTCGDVALPRWSRLTEPDDPAIRHRTDGRAMRAGVQKAPTVEGAAVMRRADRRR